MTRDDFKKYVEETIESLIQEAEKQTGRVLPRRFCFGFIKPSRVTVEQNQVAEHLTEQIFVDEQNIYPCFDLILGDILEDGRLLFVGYRAGFAPRPWQKNYTGREGPFVRMISEGFFEKFGVKKN